MAKLIYRYGSMNASKSAQLIMDWYGHQQNSKDALVFKPSLDTRDEGFISSRALNTKIPVDRLIKPEDEDDMFDIVMEILPRIVFVDEAQFLTKKQIDELGRIVDIIGVTVVAYGLLTTFKGELFEGSKRLVEIANVREEIRSECTRCNGDGLMNARYLDGEFQADGETIVVGAEESYRVLCRKCFIREAKRVSAFSW